MLKGLLYPLLTLAPVLLWTDNAFSQLSQDKKTYTVKEGDTIKSIATELGDEDYWKAIYLANTDIIKNDGAIQKGQVLVIPSALFEQPDSVMPDSTDEALLEKFRSAFDNLKALEKADSLTQPQIDPLLEFEGMVLDETRSKMGRDFYDLFYQNWASPDGSTDFTIKITEQPSPGIGTVITVMVDYEHVYSARLQPRYEYIEAVSQQAIAQCQFFIQQQAAVREQLTGY